MLSSYVGEDDYPKAIKWAKHLQFINSGISVGLAFILYFGAAWIVRLFNLASGLEEAVVTTAVLLVRIFSMEIVLKSIAHTFIESVFRAGGNPEAGLVLDTIASWVVVIPLCCFVGFYLDAGFLPVFVIMVFGEDLVKTGIASVYFRTGKWCRRLSDES